MDIIMRKIVWPSMTFPPINLYSAPLQQWHMMREQIMSKGSKRRPLRIPEEKFKENWDKVFGEKKQQTQKRNKRWYNNKGEVE